MPRPHQHTVLTHTYTPHGWRAFALYYVAAAVWLYLDTHPTHTPYIALLVVARTAHTAVTRFSHTFASRFTPHTRTFRLLPPPTHTHTPFAAVPAPPLLVCATRLPWRFYRCTRFRAVTCVTNTCACLYLHGACAGFAQAPTGLASLHITRFWFLWMRTHDYAAHHCRFARAAAAACGICNAVGHLTFAAGTRTRSAFYDYICHTRASSPHAPCVCLRSPAAPWLHTTYGGFHVGRDAS